MRLDGYDTGGFYDEMFDASGQPRPEARYLLETIGSLGDGQLQRCQQAAERALVQLGITFNVYGDSAGTERPSIAVGTFGGRVLLVDSTDNGKGRFRVLIEPDAEDQQWPSHRFLRQGVRANGWVLLNVVPLWYELWRQFNGFPPVVSLDEPAASGLEPAGKSQKPDGESAPDKDAEK